ncbi:MAG: class I SAM-dependent RNA methyltransferase [bacterium]|nr:MAG: class I SAM-dependent RNA methyltransferase [bacterium]
MSSKLHIENTGSKKTFVRIEKLVPGGDGLGHLDGKAVFVPLTAPGDLVSLRHVRRRKGVFFAEVEEVVEGASSRREPPCPWFGDCGGCQWMHLDYPSQIHWKEEIFRQAMRGIAHLRERLPVLVHQAPGEFGYRFRARLQIRGTAVGFYRRASDRVVSWERCLLLPEALNGVTRQLRGFFKGNEPPPALESCEIALSPVERTVTLNWNFSNDREVGEAARIIMDGMENLLSGGECVLAGQAARNLRGTVLAERGRGLTLEIDGVRTTASPGTFFQVNPEVNAVLVRRVMEHLRSEGSTSLLDLYCGNGNFSLASAAAGIRTVGVESSAGAVRDAVSRSVQGSLFIAMDAAKYLEQDQEKPDAVIVDPPRTGLPSKVSSLLGERKVPLLIYVSCDPSTLARDLARLTADGYHVCAMELFDMFPQSFHSEALVVMKR